MGGRVVMSNPALVVLSGGMMFGISREEIMRHRKRLDKIEYRFDPKRIFTNPTPDRELDPPHEIDKIHDRLERVERKLNFRPEQRRRDNIHPRLKRLEKRFCLS